jgi:hypothetical protein
MRATIQLLTLGLALMISTIVNAQSPDKFNYQAVVRDASGNVIPNKIMSFKVSILSGSSVGVLEYEETHSDTTNAYGLLTLIIGDGIPTSGSMSSIKWGDDIHILKIEFDPNGGTTYQRLSTVQLLSVPYALHAASATYGKDEDADSTNEIQMLSVSNDTLYLSNGGGFVKIASSIPPNFDNDSTNEIQSITLSNDTIFLSQGGAVKLPTSVNNDNDSTNELIQSVNLSNDTLIVTEPNNMQRVDLSVFNNSAAVNNLDNRIISDSNRLNSIELIMNSGAFKDSSSSNEIQTLSLSNDTIYLTNGGFVVLPTGAANNDNDSTNELVQSLVLLNDTLNLVEPNNSLTVDLSSLNNSNDISALSTRIINDSTRLNTFETIVNLGAYKDSSSSNEIQMLTLSNDTIYLTSGGFVVLPSGAANNDNDSTNELIQSLTLVNDTLRIMEPNNMQIVDLSGLNSSSQLSGLSSRIIADSVRLNSFETTINAGAYKDSSATNEIQVLSISNDTIFLTSGGFAVLPSTANLDNDSTNEYVDSLYLNNRMLILTQANGMNRDTTDLNNISHWTRNTNDISYSLGRVGIGTSSPTSLLHLASTTGNIGFQSIVSGSGGAGTLNRGLQSRASSTSAEFNQGVVGFAETASTAFQPSNMGVAGYANTSSYGNYAVYGQSTGSGVGNYGGAFYSTGTGGGNYGVLAYASNTTGAKIGLYAATDKANAGDIAAYLDGNVTITGNLSITGSISKGSGTFKIDHPLDPENKYLVHSFVESPDMMNVYNGNVTTDANGFATVTLPDYFQVANKDFRYQLTPIGQFAQCIVKEEISNNTFVIQTDKPNVKVSWQITGIRNDPYSNTHRIVAEEEKTSDNKGKYLHPKVYGKSENEQEGKVFTEEEFQKQLETLQQSGNSVKGE